MNRLATLINQIRQDDPEFRIINAPPTKEKKNDQQYFPSSSSSSCIFPDLQGKHVLITGGANGIGEAVTRAFFQQGCYVSVLDSDEAKGNRLVSELLQLELEANNVRSNNDNKEVMKSKRIRFFPIDLTNDVALTNLLQKILKNFGAVQILVNNAGYDPRYDVTKMTTSEWEKLFHINVQHYFVTCREIIPAMIRNGQGGSVIMTSSVQFFVGEKNLACYTATKGAIVGFMKSLAREVGGENIRVNCISPGWIMTERQLSQRISVSSVKKLITEWQCVPEFLTPEKLAPTFLFLGSDASRTISRQNLLADGGWAQN